MANVELTPLKLNSWRKIALGTWRRPGDPSVYGTLEFNATKLLERQKRWSDRHGGAKPPTITAIFAKAVAMTLHKHPQINGLIRFGRIYNRRSVAVFLQTAVDDEGKELSGFVIYDAEKKTLEQFVEEIAAKARSIRAGNDAAFKQAKSTFGPIPAFEVGWILDLLSFFLYTLNLNLSWLGLPRDPFGSVMVTSIGSLGMDEAYGPLVPYSRVPLLVAVGAVRDRPIAVDGQVVVAPILRVGVTFDHRFIDGMMGSKMAKTVRRILETEEGLDELGL